MTSRVNLAGPTVHLGTLGPFRALSPMNLARIAVEAEEVVFEPESWLIRRGVEQKAMYMVMDGHVRVFGAEGPSVAGPGELVGFPDLFVPGARALGALSDSEVVALRLETDALRDVCERNFSVIAGLLSWLAGEVAADRDARLGVIGGLPEPASQLPAVARDRVLRMLALQRAPAFPLESMDALAELAGRVVERTVEAGEILWEEGAPADRFWVVAAGAVALREAAGDSVMRTGGVPGFPETLGGLAYRGRAEVVESGLLLSVDVDPFMDVLEDHFELAFSTLGWMSRFLSDQSAL